MMSCSCHPPSVNWETDHTCHPAWVPVLVHFLIEGMDKCMASIGGRPVRNGCLQLADHSNTMAVSLPPLQLGTSVHLLINLLGP